MYNGGAGLCKENLTKTVTRRRDPPFIRTFGHCSWRCQPVIAPTL